jgi:hypothetical protein
MAGHGVHFPHHPLLSPGKIGSRKPFLPAKGRKATGKVLPRCFKEIEQKGTFIFQHMPAGAWKQEILRLGLEKLVN